jgi:hypothetical protein
MFRGPCGLKLLGFSTLKGIERADLDQRAKLVQGEGRAGFVAQSAFELLRQSGDVAHRVLSPLNLRRPAGT